MVNPDSLPLDGGKERPIEQSETQSVSLLHQPPRAHALAAEAVAAGAQQLDQDPYGQQLLWTPRGARLLTGPS
jgi:hypothetical protein